MPWPGARRLPLCLCIPAFLLQFLVLHGLRYALPARTLQSIWATPFAEQLNMGLVAGDTGWQLTAIYSLLTITFLLTALAFVPVGQLCGKTMARRENLRAYRFNLLGSLLGVILISTISMFWTPPTVWFSIGFALLLMFQGFSPRALLFGSVTALLAVTALAWPLTPGVERIHSPYQLLERGPGEAGLTSIKAAGHYFQRVHDLALTNANRERNPELERVAAYYELPYRIHRGPLQTIAIVGSGTGNDVAAALRCGAEQVDAIEIDPVVLRLGRMYHPERPYEKPQVRTIVDDARTYLRRTGDDYDMIVYGLLDSHTLLSHGSSVRLDSFVYTVEALREARARLQPEGLLSLSFCVASPEIGRKIYLMLQEAFGGIAPVCIRADYDRSIIFLQTRNGGLQLDPELLDEERGSRTSRGSVPIRRSRPMSRPTIGRSCTCRGGSIPSRTWACWP